MRGLSVRGKVLSVAAVVLAVAAILGATAIGGLGTVNSSATTMYRDNLTQVKTLAAVRADVAATRVALLNYVTSVAPAARATQKDNPPSGSRRRCRRRRRWTRR